MKINADDEEEDYTLFGRVLLRWGYVEVELVNIILRLTHPLFHLPDHDGVPVPFGRKIKLAKRGYKEIPAMTHLRTESSTILGSLWNTSETRNVIAHGYYQGFTGGDRYMFGFYEARPGKRRSFKAYYFSRDDILKLETDIETSLQRLGELSAKTFAVPFP